MIHKLAHNEIAAFVLSCSSSAAATKEPNEKQTKKIQLIENAVDECANAVFTALSENKSTTILESDYFAMFGYLLWAEGAVRILALELEDRGIALEEKSFVRHMRPDMIGNAEFILTPRKKVSQEQKSEK